MNDRDELLRLYEEELTHLRSMGVEFARKYPKVAERLELGADRCADPYVERLIESFAYLTARLRYNIDRQFAEIPTALLNVLYPHYLNPIPSMAIARFEIDPTQGKLTSGFTIPRHTPLFAQSHQGGVYRFRTSYPVTLWPLEVAEVGIVSADQLDLIDIPRNAVGALRIKLRAVGVSLQEIDLRRLRFHLNGELLLVHTLYELLFKDVVRIALVPQGSARPVWLDDDAIQPVGFGVDEDVLPYARHAHPQYRILQEYFTFPEKFLFFDIKGLERHGSTETFEILFFLKSTPKTRLAIRTETFELGCVPIINLFRKTTEPIRLTHLQSEYPLIPDGRREGTTEIHSILSVSSSSNIEEDSQQLKPFYSFNHQSEQRDGGVYWYARRSMSERKGMAGTTMALTLVDLHFTPTLPATKTIFAHTLCTNRHSASQLPAGTQLQMDEAAPVARIYCATKPTRQIDPPLSGETYWRLISHLSLNYLSLTEGTSSLRALREILELYNYINDSSSQQQIMGLVGVDTRMVTRRLGREAWRGFCQGTEVTLTFDDTKYVGGSAFLLASVLNRFLPLYASINSFTQLSARSVQRDTIWKSWPPMVGEQTIL